MPTDDIARLYDFTPNTTAQSGQVDDELNQLVNTCNGKAGRSVANAFTAHNTLTSATMSSTLTLTHATTPCLVDKIGEYTAGAGVTIDSVLLKDGMATLSGVPSAAGQVGYDSSVIKFHNGSSVKTLVHTGQSIDVLNDVDTTSAAPSVGDALTWNGTNWVPGSIGDLVLLSTATASTSATVDFTTLIDSTYDHYIVEINGLKAATDQTNLLMRVYDATLAAWQSDAADYQWAGRLIVNTNEGSNSSTGDSSMNLTASLGTLAISNADPYRAAYQIHIFNPSATGYSKSIIWDGAYRTAAASNYIARIAGAGTYVGATNAITGIRFLMSSGNITSGSFYLYGVKKS